MNNHTATHLLNFALRKHCGEADQKGSLVTDDKLRFDFSYKAPLSTKQLEGVDEVVNQFIEKNDFVYAANAPLGVAREIQGLRAMFDETYPDPVRVVSVGINVDDLVADPVAPAGSVTSVEFCGGTHLLKTGHMKNFTVVSEKPIAKGIRRIFAVTGSEADSAIARGLVLQSEADNLVSVVNSGKFEYNETISKINTLIAENDIAVQPAWRRDSIRDVVTGLKAKLDKAQIDADKAFSNQNAAEISKLIAERQGSKYIVHVLTSKGTSKGISEGLKEMRKKLPETCGLIFGVNNDDIFFHCLVPKKVSGTNSIRADEWLASFSGLINAKCGGKDLYAQGSGKGAAEITRVVNLGKQFIEEKLK